ncbi:MAG: phosphoenolpyruvate synthase [Actinobacteria bacterium]|nr:phosphoenolpyruvate synthase [Actinomycetota bacterium]
MVGLRELSREDIARVGGKNASLGEMLRELTATGINVPPGFAITVDGYRAFLEVNALEAEVAQRLDELREGRAPLREVGRAIRAALQAAELPQPLREEIAHAYRELAAEAGRDEPDVAVRSSATAEDLPEASFAGQQDTFLNVRGTEAIFDACRRCFASLFTDRAITYREQHGFDHLQVSLSVGVQQMVRSDLACAGVMFSIDTETGFPGIVLIDAARGLGELLVAGAVDPDEHLVFKPLLDEPSLTPIIARKLGGKEQKMVYGEAEQPTRVEQTSEEERTTYALCDREILQLARWAVALERHYGGAVDVEWAKDGLSGELFIVQARPETVHSRRKGAALKTYRLTGEGRRLATGLAVGDAIGVGPACPLQSVDEAERFEDGAVLVTQMTDPDWLPIMKRAAAIVTEHGGRTSHAAIVSRELGLPAIVGAHGVTDALEEGQTVTVCCAEGEEGFVYDGALDFEVEDIDVSDVADTETRVMLNLADPAVALRWWQLPAQGVGLARMEFIVDNHVKIHPLALARFDELHDDEARDTITDLTRGYDDKREYFVERLAEGIARIAASRHPHPVILRMSDFKTNEYAQLIGGRQFEPHEENPMLGWRGASRYYSEGYRQGFALECAAVRRVREQMGLKNLVVMIPFCRTLEEADRVLEAMADSGLVRGEDGLEVYVMAEIPSNVVLADAFAERFDGFSIGSNDLTQLVLGIDRDNEALAEQFDESNPAVRRMIAQLIESAHDRDRKVGLCGQKPSDDATFARFLVDAGIDSISVTPDSFIAVKHEIARAERERAATAS